MDINRINKLLDQHFNIVGKFTVHAESGVVDVTGDVQLLPNVTGQLPVQFGSVSGDFICEGRQLTSLVGSPKTVGGGFMCAHNQLQSLTGAPHSVGDSFSCGNNMLTSLTHAPQSVGGHFWCFNNQLTTLSGATRSVPGDFWCQNNPLESLEGAPMFVGGQFYCVGTSLESLQGAPPSVMGEFECDYSATLPLLRVLQYKKVRIVGVPKIVKNILKPYLGKGKPVALACAAELIQAGFQDNARW